MPPVFVDTACYIALLLQDDDAHSAAHEVLSLIPQSDQVTSKPVLVELLAYLSRRPSSRDAGIDLVASLRQSGVLIIPQTSRLFEAGLQLYRLRRDKTYSLTDCMSMVICKERGIREVVTHDRDFSQEGFTILL
ncbi:MAG: PIN domain-containing protein [Dehalococcoidia bacterium]